MSEYLCKFGNGCNQRQFHRKMFRIYRISMYCLANTNPLSTPLYQLDERSTLIDQSHIKKWADRLMFLTFVNSFCTKQKQVLIMARAMSRIGNIPIPYNVTCVTQDPIHSLFDGTSRPPHNVPAFSCSFPILLIGPKASSPDDFISSSSWP